MASRHHHQFGCAACTHQPAPRTAPAVVTGAISDRYRHASRAMITAVGRGELGVDDHDGLQARAAGAARLPTHLAVAGHARRLVVARGSGESSSSRR